MGNRSVAIDSSDSDSRKITFEVTALDFYRDTKSLIHITS